MRTNNGKTIRSHRMIDNNDLPGFSRNRLLPHIFFHLIPIFFIITVEWRINLIWLFRPLIPLNAQLMMLRTTKWTPEISMWLWDILDCVLYYPLCDVNATL
jgi:hypothetical protein